MKNVFFMMTFFTMVFCNGQKSVVYPKGVYKTFEDFKAKIPNEVLDYTKKETSNGLAYRFNEKETDKRESRAFAISDGENLYVRIKSMWKEFPKNDKGQTPDTVNTYLKVNEIGKYYYAQYHFASTGASIFGGLAGGLAARRQKAIIYNTETEEYDLIRNTKEFKKFLEKNEPSLVSKYEAEKAKGGKEVEAIKATFLELAK